jgi:hypothetical protein
MWRHRVAHHPLLLPNSILRSLICQCRGYWFRAVTRCALIFQTRKYQREPISVALSVIDRGSISHARQ